MPEIVAVSCRFYSVPTKGFGVEQAETDGTARWDSTGVLIVAVEAAGQTGLGYAYTAPAALAVARDILVSQVMGQDAFDTGRAFWAMAGAVRNSGWPGIAASAISAMDLAIHDLKCKLLGVSLVQLLGGARPRVMAYGSGGFTSYSVRQLQEQLGAWAENGLRAMKMKIGRTQDEDLARVAAAREAIGPDVALFVDANGAYDRKQALKFAELFAAHNVSWFEEPVSSDDLTGLRLIRDRAPGGMQIAAGEYGYTPAYFHAMLTAGAVDTLQADSTRCGGVTGFALAAAQAQAAGIPLSAHTAPAVHASLASAFPNVINVEYFHDHVRIEDVFFDGLPVLRDGYLVPDRDRPGHGLELKALDAEPYLTERWKSD
jgi:L-alanine-DL-glutamate epimerase-like enolase superfamily enzyme